jgi:adenylosuccinate lyase
MIDRYTRKEMRELWSDKQRFLFWLQVELAVLTARVYLREIENAIPKDLESQIQIDPDEINRIEDEKTRHDILAFLEHVSPQFPEHLRPWLHRGMTSYDVVDTALMLAMRESLKLILEKIDRLLEVIKKRALEHKYTVKIGRTHGVHAEPITLGVEFANWHEELQRHKIRLERTVETISVGKISGAVGMYTLPPEVETVALRHLKLDSIIATQIISRDLITEVLGTLANLSATIGKIALNIRLAARTEVQEILEFFDVNQKGSSAMPHKKNPIGPENLCGLMRQVVANHSVAAENQANCWEQRSLDNSGIERVIIPDSMALVDYALARLTGIIEKMLIFPENMLCNLNLTRGLVYSQNVMMLVAEKSGLPREDAHTLVRNVAIRCWETKEDFFSALCRDPKICDYVSFEELSKCFDLERKIQYVDFIFKIVFGE